MARRLSSAKRRQMAEAAIDQAAELRGEPLPTEAELRLMSEQEIDDYLRSLGVEIDWERIEASVRSQLGEEVILLNRQESLTQARADELEKRTQRAIVSTARDIANKSMGDMRFNAMFEGDDRPESEIGGIWVSVGEGACPDCFVLHGEVRALDFWRGSMPRDGKTVCGRRCRCTIAPYPLERRREGLRVEEARRGLDPINT